MGDRKEPTPIPLGLKKPPPPPPPKYTSHQAAGARRKKYEAQQPGYMAPPEPWSDPPPDWYRCCCTDDVEVGSYDNQLWVHAPAHMPKDSGYCLDVCVAEEVMSLWRAGVKTLGCCCGHGDHNLAFIQVPEEFPLECLGYERTEKQPEQGIGYKPRFRPIDGERWKFTEKEGR